VWFTAPSSCHGLCASSRTAPHPALAMVVGRALPRTRPRPWWWAAHCSAPGLDHGGGPPQRVFYTCAPAGSSMLVWINVCTADVCDAGSG
jgi:hypothetical protein